MDKFGYWMVFGYIGGVILLTVLMGVFVLSPSYEDKRERCAAVGGVIIDGGACVKRETVLEY